MLRSSLSLLFFLLLVGSDAALAGTCTVNDDYIGLYYSGECANGLANGYGTAKGMNEYVGYFQDGLPHGKGTYLWKKGRDRKGDRFEGAFENGQPKEGVYTFSNGDRYEGLFNFVPGGRRNLYEIVFGEVRYRMQFGRYIPKSTGLNIGKDYYSGEFNSPGASTRRMVNSLNGFWEVGGVQGSDYYNRFSLGAIGELSENGTYVVQGYFENDTLKRKCKNKIACTAHEWLPDERTGCTVRNYHRYSTLLFGPQPLQNVTWSGACKDGKAEGSGVVQFYWDGKPTERFEGLLVEGKIKHGKYFLDNGTDIREGEFVDDLLHGKGTITLSNGEAIAATFDHGSIEGFATRKDRSGNVIRSGIYENNELVLACQSQSACEKLLTQRRIAQQNRRQEYTPSDRNGGRREPTRFECSFICRGSMWATGGRHSISVTAQNESSARESIKDSAEKTCRAEGLQRDGAWWADISICEER